MVNRKVRFAIWWRRAGVGLRLTVLLAGLAAFSLLMYWQRPEEEPGRGSGAFLVFVLVHLNIVILCVLAFLIGRNIIKLIFDRRRGLLGARLKSRLVVAFVGLTLIPTSILFMLASGLLTRAMEGWFSGNIEESVNGAVEVARHHYQWLKDFAQDFSVSLGDEIQKRPELGKNQPALKSWLDGKRKAWGIFSISILSPSGEFLTSTKSAAATIENFSEPPPDQDALKRAIQSETGVLFEEKEASQFVRAYSPVRIGGQPAALMLTLRVSPELSQALSSVNDAFREYEQLKFFNQPIKTNYILTLSMITGLILFSALWVAFYIARELVGPIQRLAEATRHVAQGRYDFQIREKGDDEMGLLVQSFNKMTSEIRRSRMESENRRVYIETLLANLAVGVIALDSRRRVNSVNAAAARIFAVLDIQALNGRALEEVVGIENFEKIKPLIDEMEEPMRNSQPGELLSERQITVLSQGRELKIICTAGQIRDTSGDQMGSVFLFDDITELSKAQHMAAWREVAQRIAHEIKNPLTPIQLSAQRLEKLVSESNLPEHEKKERVIDCSSTIVEHVDSIKRLANEFSRFARMPESQFAPASLNELVSDVFLTYAENNGSVVFQFIADPELPPVHMDSEQIRRCVMNLVENAVAALKTYYQGKDGSEGPHVTGRTTWDSHRKMAVLEILDNGPGIQGRDKSRVFEPYFTTKQGGTGLGLAIVTSVVTDHHGFVRVYDSPPHGARFVVELPISQSRSTQRKFAA